EENDGSRRKTTTSRRRRKTPAGRAENPDAKRTSASAGGGSRRRSRAARVSNGKPAAARLFALIDLFDGSFAPCFDPSAGRDRLARWGEALYSSCASSSLGP